MCLDLSHAWLHCSYHKIDYLKYLEKVAPIATHLHISDAQGIHNEGLQIGDGEVPFDRSFEILSKYQQPNKQQLSWVPEVWHGHLQEYQGFKTALSALVKYSFLNAK